MWHQAILRLAEATQDVSDKMDLLMEAGGKDLRLRSRELIESLVNFLDVADGNPDLEECDDDGEGEDAEPSLGSFDRMMDQSKSWRTSNVVWINPGSDLEQDDCDAEDSDPAEDKQQPPVMGGEA